MSGDRMVGSEMKVQCRVGDWTSIYWNLVAMLRSGVGVGVWGVGGGGGCFFFQAEDGIRDLVRSRGLGDVYKRQC